MGKVFVEKRACTKTMALSICLSNRSGYISVSCWVVSMPLYTRVRALRLGKYVSSEVFGELLMCTSCSMRLRAIYMRLSRSMPDKPSPVMNGCRNVGTLADDPCPKIDWLTGTSRQPITLSPSSCMMRSTSFIALAAVSGSRGKNPIPVA